MLVGVKPQRLARWINGYDKKTGSEKTHHEPLWPLELPEIDGYKVLGFRDLIEALFISNFVKAGLSLPLVRKALIALRDIVDDDHPFSTGKMRTDGKSLFLEIARDIDEAELLNIVSNQHAFKKIIEPSFKKQFDFNDEIVSRWYPDYGKKIVIDPKRSFGDPILAKSGVPTDTLYEYSKHHPDIKKISQWFEIPEADVRAAIAFESNIAEAA
tara:strand:- start:819 stop:1457 length:639 start_codon:yes stop_codon:yes gene_type:complete